MGRYFSGNLPHFKTYTMMNSIRIVRSAAILALFALSSVGNMLQAQVSTNGGSGLALTYPDLNSAITALNGSAITSPVVITLTGNETAPAGGYVITAEGTAVNTITIQGTSSTITASAALTAGTLNDGIFKIIGGDFITLTGFTMQENAANTVTASATNNMTEWGVALLYTTATNGCQNVTIQGNTISLNRTYQNTFGIYSNSTHSATAVSTSATATGATGGNHNLKIYSNNISNVNIGMLVVGPTAGADANNSVEVGGSALLANTVSDYGTTGTFSSYANVSGTVNGILVRNSINYTITHNSITSSNGGTIAGTLRGIYVPAASNAHSGTYANTISNNVISLTSGVAGGTIHGVFAESTSGSATGSLVINNNNFTALNYSVAATGTTIGINATSAVLNLTINGNTFNGLSTNTTGAFTFISHSYSMPASGSQTITNNIVNNFTKTGAGGTVTFSTTNGSSPNSASGIYSNNSISNVTLTGATGFTGINNTDGAGTSANKVINGNTISSITGGTSAILGINVTYWGGTSSSISGNSILNLNGQGAITGISLGNTFAGATNSVISANNIAGLFSTGTGGAVTGLTCSNTSTGIVISSNNIGTLSSTGASAVTALAVTNATATTVSGNNICSLSGSNPSSTINGVLVSNGTLVTVLNNVIGGLDAPLANAANPVNGINVTGGTTVNVYYNTVRVAGTSAGALFGSSALSLSTTPTVAVRNNILENAGTPVGGGFCTALRRSTTTLTTYDNASNNNDLVGSTIFTDGTTTHATLAAYQGMVTPRDATSINVTPTYLSTTCGNANFLRLDPAVLTALESGGANIVGITTDIDGQTRAGNGGYAGTGTAPDIGADEVETTLPSCTSVDAGTIATSTVNLCLSSPTTTMTSTGSTLGAGISYQWKVSSVSGGPYTNVLGGTGATTASFTTPSLLVGVYYFVLEATCSNGPIVDLSNEVTVNVYNNPTVAISPSSATYCAPGGTAVSLTASGANTYVWSPAGGLSATTGAAVDASPAANTTYTVTGTDVNNCTAAANVTVSVGTNPIIASVTATPATVCSGGNSQLQANVGTLVNAYNFSAGTGTTLDPMTGATTVIGSGVDDTPTAAPANIGFDFNFNGVTYTQYSVSPDGWILLGGATAVSQFTNAVASTTNIPKIYPLWDDLATGTDGNVQVLVTGTAPNRIFIVQWFVTIPRNTAGPANATYQAWLYETTNVIEYRYGAFASPTSASVGLTAGATNFHSASFATNTSSTTVANNTIATAPAAGTIYTYAPPAITYAWSPATFLNNAAISNPAATAVTSTTAYTVTASVGSCSVNSSVTLTAGSPLTSSASITPSNTVCAGSNVTISAAGNGGGAPYTYAWTGPNGFVSTAASNPLTGVTALQAGVYTVTVTDNCGATSISTVTLNVNALPIVDATPSTSTYCAPGTGVTLTANGASTYSWSPAAGLSATTGSSVIATPSATTTYTVVGTDGNGCSASATAVVNYALAVTSVTSTATPASTCDSTSSLNAVATIAPATYCQPTYTNGTGFGDYISSVQLNTLNNTTTGAASPYYTLYPTSGATTTTLTAGTTYTITLAAGTYTDNDVAAWIDFNQNGTLDDVNEKLGETDGLGATPTTTSFTFTVPLTAANGTTRMRVRDADGTGTNYMTPCGVLSSYGETEDYTITIVGGVDPYTVTWSPATFLSSTTGATVNATGITTSTTYTATVSTPAGCSNTATSTITLLPSSVSTTTVSTCGSYTWTNGTTYNTSGSYTQTLVNSVGCDSVATLNLTILQPTSSTVTATACDTYTWAENGTTYTTSGTYSVVSTGANAVGCDSTVILNLTINNSTTGTETVTECDSYVWAADGNTYTTSGTYTATLTNAVGCDSIVTLNLTINNSTTGFETVTECDSYVWAADGNTYTTSGTYTATLTNAAGCDSVVTLNLTINNATTGSETASACDSYVWSADGNTYTTSGTYTATLTNAAGCDSTVTLNLTITSTPTATVTDNGDGTITASSGASYQWIDCDSGLAIVGETNQTLTVTANGSYAVVVSNGTCSDTSACAVIDYIGIKELAETAVQLMPNPTRDNVTITMSVASAMLEVRDAQGKLMVVKAITSGEQVDLSQAEVGVYFFTIKTANGSVVKRVVKN